MSALIPPCTKCFGNDDECRHCRGTGNEPISQQEYEYLKKKAELVVEDNVPSKLSEPLRLVVG